jgi:hypothetical protein
MYEQIQANKPLGATHWHCGTYYKKVNPVEWYYWEEDKWKFTSYVSDLSMPMTTL